MRRALAALALIVVVPPLGLVMATSTGGARWPVAFDPASLTGEIPEPMLSAYLDAAQTWDIDWALLAAIGNLECDHGR